MKLIEGVKTKTLKAIADERGFLMEILRSDDSIFEGFGQIYITGCKEGVAKAWHYHKEQADHFVCVLGKALIVLYDMREGSTSFGEVQELILEAPPCKDTSPILLKIPPLVVHGFTALEGPEARIINIPTLPYRYQNPDEFRYPWNSPAIPYRWSPQVVMGG